MKKAMLIINPCAGKTKAKTHFFTLVQHLSKGDILPTVYLTKKQGDAVTFVKTAAPHFDLVICCGGDGTLNETVNGMLSLPKEQRRPLGYVPCGSTNDFAAALGLPSKIDKIAACITAGKTQSIDIGSFNGRFFTYVASFGAFTSVSYSTSQQAKNSLGHFAYILGGAKALANIRAQTVEYDCDGVTGSGQFIFGAVSNTTSLGGVYKLPQENISLTDGKFELILLKNTAYSPETLWNIVHRKLAQDENIIYLHGKKITLRSADAIPFTLDGEFGGDHPEVTVRCLPQRIRVIE